MGKEGATVYHSTPQAYRIQKRLALNQSFRIVRDNFGSIGPFVYVTLGGADLYDAMDLVSVFNIRQHVIRVVCFEHDEATAEACRCCPVATTLSQVDTVTIEIIVAQFPSMLDRLHAMRAIGPFIYFLDYTGTFKQSEADSVSTLLESRLVLPGDFVLITSCLSPRIVHNDRFMARYDSSFRLMFKPSRLDNAFRDRNHVDLLLALALSRLETTRRPEREPRYIGADLLGKYKYQDSRSPMGLWVYRIIGTGRRIGQLRDVAFDEFPHAFAMPVEPEIPNIFD
jgi:hypothetical protein